MKSYRPTNIKAHNQLVITQVLRDNQVPLTKSQLSTLTNLSVVTINKLLPEMVTSQQIRELPAPVATGGRKALVYQLNHLFHVILIMQILEINNEIQVLFTVTDMLGGILADNQLGRERLSPESILTHLRSFKHDFPTLDTVIIGIPGVAVNDTLKIMDYEPLVNLNIKELLAAEDITNLLIENDVNAATLGFINEAEQISAGLYFPKEFPPGAALVINNQIFHGKNNLSGEIKHLPSYQKMTYPISSPKEISAALSAALQTIISMYDPEEIIVFLPTSWQADLNFNEITLELERLFPYDVLPIITLSDQFETYHRQGLIRLGVSLVEGLD